jgi:hypothetical protein
MEAEPPAELAAAEPAAAAVETAPLAQGNPDTATSIYEFSCNDLDGNPHSVSEWAGKVVIVMNVASA